MATMTFLAVCFVLAAGASAAPVGQAAQFEQYQLQFNKSYASPAEHQLRLAAFGRSLAKIAELNGIEGEEVYGLTKFSDLTPEEFKARYLSGFRRLTDPANVPVLEDPPMPLNVTGSVDWRTKHKVTPVKDQGQCGSCWAFSATEEIESAWLMAGNEQEILAPQQITSCDKKDLGCNGGDTPTAYKYVMKAGGMVTEKAYPYKSGKSGKSGKCKNSAVSGKKAVTIKGFSYATTPKPNDATEAGRWKANEAKMAQAMATKGPMSICVDAEVWQNYKSGVVTKTCKKQLDQ